MSKDKFDSRAVGLDIGLAFSRWLTGKENLHYGIWEGLDVCAGNVGDAQEAYSFRSETFTPDKVHATVGGGHPIAAFRSFLADMPLDIVSEEDVTADVAPSIDVEQGLFNVVGYGLTRVDQQMASQRPKLRGFIRWVIRRVLKSRTTF